MPKSMTLSLRGVPQRSSSFYAFVRALSLTTAAETSAAANFMLLWTRCALFCVSLNSVVSFPRQVNTSRRQGGEVEKGGGVSDGVTEMWNFLRRPPQYIIYFFFLARNDDSDSIGRAVGLPRVLGSGRRRRGRRGFFRDLNLFFLL